MSRLKITCTKSCIGYPQDQKGTLKALGLRRRGDVVEQSDCPVIRGMVGKVKHLVTVEVVE